MITSDFSIKRQIKLYSVSLVGWNRNREQIQKSVGFITVISEESEFPDCPFKNRSLRIWNAMFKIFYDIFGNSDSTSKLFPGELFFVWLTESLIKILPKSSEKKTEGFSCARSDISAHSTPSSTIKLS